MDFADLKYRQIKLQRRIVEFKSKHAVFRRILVPSHFVKNRHPVSANIAMKEIMNSKIVVFLGYQRFKCVGIKEYRKKNSRVVPLLIMQSYCPDCGRKYETMIRKKVFKSTWSLNRRCDKCKKPGVRIRATRCKIFGI